MIAFLGLLVVAACGLCFVIGQHKRRIETPPEQPKHLVYLGEMKVSEAMVLAIPTTELFCKEKHYTDRMPDDVWMSWPGGRRVHVYWLTDQEIS